MLVLRRVFGRGKITSGLRPLCEDTLSRGRYVAKRVAQIEKVTGQPVSLLYRRKERLPAVTHDRIVHVRTSFAHLQSGEASSVSDVQSSVVWEGGFEKTDQKKKKIKEGWGGGKKKGIVSKLKSLLSLVSI